jgi:hypothetical protein
MFSKHDVINNLRNKVKRLEEQLARAKTWYLEYYEHGVSDTLAGDSYLELGKILEIEKE